MKMEEGLEYASTSHKPLEAIKSWKRQGMNSPLGPPEESGSTNLILTQWNWSQTCGLQNCDRLSVVLSYGVCVFETAAIGN